LQITSIKQEQNGLVTVVSAQLKHNTDIVLRYAHYGTSLLCINMKKC